MARPKSEEKKQALLEAATAAIAQLGISAPTSLIARKAGVAEGTLFRYFATKDELLNGVYLFLKQDLCQFTLENIDSSEHDARKYTNYIWNCYIDWAILHPEGHRTMRQLAVSDKITEETEQQGADMYPEMYRRCEQSVRPIFRTSPFRTFGHGMFMALADTTMEFATRDPERAAEYKNIGFEATWKAITNGE
ncbi:TetR/AcrR family transcriptional regulator [Enterobacillus tribolii]|uniref:TetR family transcriptional regulator n=1 Tax=Enterobacillus tribolii TaxID=1487935 RepID=A0A370QU50_9GAMM|nr:TetR/AcrR family transcriptional regulator [Enterobacillus tribolii]MBW7981164.1 TetR/AcrR family transcriptional regulator [Enterobacillus tribolii]RDK92777.1 TetR family transcriptional regulator [Enterobacillus tribolii]